MNTVAKCLRIWGYAIGGGLVGLVLVSTLLDTYEKAGWSGMLMTAVVLSALPALAFGFLLRRD